MKKITPKASIIFLILFSIPGSSGPCKWHDIEVRDTLDIFLSNTMVGKLVHKVEYHEKAGIIVDSTDKWIDADVSGTGHSGNRIEMRESRTFNDQGYMVSAYQELIGQSGTNSWALSKNPGGWDLSITVGGQKTKKKSPGFPIIFSPIAACARK
jgi:hypothetical protein